MNPKEALLVVLVVLIVVIIAGTVFSWVAATFWGR
jgi:hypothetical protein